MTTDQQVWIPTLSRSEILYRAGIIRPVKYFDDKGLFYVKADLDDNLLSDDLAPTDEATRLEKMVDIITFHSADNLDTAMKFIFPTTREVLSQIPKELLDTSLRAFQVMTGTYTYHSVLTDNFTPNSALTAGFHATVTRLYRLKI